MFSRILPEFWKILENVGNTFPDFFQDFPENSGKCILRYDNQVPQLIPRNLSNYDLDLRFALGCAQSQKEGQKDQR